MAHIEVQTKFDNCSTEPNTIIPKNIRNRTRRLLSELASADNSVARLAGLYCTLSTTPAAISRYVRDNQQGIDVDRLLKITYNREEELSNPGSKLNELIRDSKTAFAYITGQHDYRLGEAICETREELRTFTMEFCDWDAYASEIIRESIPRPKHGSMTKKMWAKELSGMPFDRQADVNFLLEFGYSRERVDHDDGEQHHGTAQDLYSCHARAKSASRYLAWTLNGATIPSMLERLYFALRAHSWGTPERELGVAFTPYYSGHSQLALGVIHKTEVLLRSVEKRCLDMARKLGTGHPIEPRRL